ncbi:MAG: hypothetical protein QNK03_14480 [Myxococcota bacterium]|nr:hypothetical protein [Myxococcota bacterium]
MSGTAALLVGLSVLLHVGWNAAGKLQRPSAGFMLAANALGGVCLLPLLVAYAGHLPELPAEAWLSLAATGLCQALYFVALAGAYRAGELSVAYPIARSFPPVLLLAAAFALGRGGALGPAVGAGIVLIVAGGLALPLRRFAELRPGRYANACCALALLAALGTAGYSLLDDHALRLLRGLPGAPLDATGAALLWAPLEAYSTALWLLAYVALVPSERAAWPELRRGALRPAFAVGAGMFASYTLVLVAMAFARDVTYVVAFRQLSVPLGAVVGVAWLGEPRSAPKWVGVGLASVGLLLVALG